jgi:uncharacterized protein (DUF4213/DUF364 family)
MKIIEDLLSTLDYEAPLKEIRQGPFQTAVLTRYCGLASTPHDSGPHHSRAPVKEAGLLLGKQSREIARLAESESLLEAAIGMAAINSLLEVNDEACLELNAGKLIAEKGKDKRVAIVGHFPFINQLQQVAKELWVIERNPGEGDRNEDEADDLIPRADVIGITGTSFTNHTIERLLELCSPRAYVVILGDTAPLSRLLFDYGVDAISGTRVTSPELALKYVSEGATYRQIKGIRRLTMLK